MGKVVDHTGVRYGKAVGIRPTEKRSKSKNIVWLWKCDCGTEFEAIAAPFVYRNYSAGCRSCSVASRARAAGDMLRTHGMHGTKEYQAWCRVKGRVFNPNNQDYPVYSKLGMDKDLAESFEAFYKEIGPYPDDGMHYSVDRIDNTVGYHKNNIRWATDAQQARNKCRMSNNTIGITGVHVREDKYGNFRATAYWTDLNGKQHSKSFSFKKYGEDAAFLLACQYREGQLRLLNQQGAGYSPNHGK